VKRSLRTDAARAAGCRVIPQGLTGSGGRRAPRRGTKPMEGRVFRAVSATASRRCSPRNGARPRSRRNGTGARVAATRRGCSGGFATGARERAGRGFFEGCEVRRGEWGSDPPRLAGQPVESDGAGVRKRGEPRPAPVATHRRLQRGGNRRGGLEPRGRNVRLRVAPQPRRGVTPGSGRAAERSEERHSANEHEEGPVRRSGSPETAVATHCRERRAMSSSPRDRRRATGGREPATVRAPARAGGDAPW